jgi:hypothetical protein
MPQALSLKECFISAKPKRKIFACALRAMQTRDPPRESGNNEGSIALRPPLEALSLVSPGDKE